MPLIREGILKYYKLQCACSEIKRLNIEVPRLATFIRNESHRIPAYILLIAQTDKALAHEISRWFTLRSAINAKHLSNISKIWKLKGNTLSIVEGSRLGGDGIPHGPHLPFDIDSRTFTPDSIEGIQEPQSSMSLSIPSVARMDVDLGAEGDKVGSERVNIAELRESDSNADVQREGDDDGEEGSGMEDEIVDDLERLRLWEDQLNLRS